ncbi:hypothetical protein FRB90_006152, partial [Tulasnella sp. 427]
MFDVSFSAQTTSQSQDPIHLQRLRSFELKHLDSAMTYEILATIRAPNCEVARLTFTSRLEGHPMESFFTVRLSHFFNLMQRGTDTDSCNINYHSETAVSLGWTGACDIFLEMETLAFARDTFLWLTEPTETSHSKKPVQLSIDLHGADSQTTRDILSMLEGLGVQSIRLGLYVPAQEALQHLLNSDPSKQGLSRWSFPELHTICINGDILSEDWADFVTALRRRQEDATSSLDDQERPKSITRVIIGLYYVEENHERLVNFRSTYWPNGMDQVRSLLGPEGEVIWPSASAERHCRVPLRHPYDEETRLRTIISCDEDLDALRLAQKEAERRVILASRQRNTFSLINTLPVDLLIDIFHHAVYSGSFVECDMPITLILVCHHWNQIVNDTPTLWTSIQKSSDRPLKKVLKALEKSKNAPLDISFDSWSFDPEQEEFLLAIFPYAERWRELSLERLASAAELGALATLSAPLLKSIRITFDGALEWEEPHPLDLFRGDSLPKLKRVQVHQLPIRWNPNLLCNLTSLEISYVSSFGPALDEVLAVLSACPDLESFSANNVLFSAQTVGQSQDPILLQRLKRFELQHLDPPVTKAILAKIRAPNCETGALSFRSRPEGNPLESFFTVNISHFFNIMRRRGEKDFCSIGYDFDGTVMFEWTGVCSIYIEMENMAFAKDTFLWFTAPTVSSLSIQPVKLTVGLHGANSQTTPDILSTLDGLGVHSITLGPSVPTQEALQHLLDSDSSKQGLSRWSFPALDTIWIDGDILPEDWTNFVNTLRRRQEEAIGPLDDHERPKPVVKLVIGSYYTDQDHDQLVNFRSTYWPKRMDQIRSMMGPEGR